MENTVNGLTFRSNFDSGNLGRVECIGGDDYMCHVTGDCEGTPHANSNSTWFHFEVQGGDVGRTVMLHIKSLNAQTKLYGHDMRPVVRKGKGSWSRITTRPHTVATQQHFVVSWPYTFDGTDPVRFAFTYPYSYCELKSHLAQWELLAKQSSIVFERSVLTKSLDGRDLDMLRITSPKGRDSDKKIALFTARVHPGETPASHMLHGLIDFLLSDNPQAAALRANFVFKIVPMLNPDGVARGHYRSDTNGVNLNRMYDCPKMDKHPTIYAVKKLFLSLHGTGRLTLYIDFHAHATKRGCFVYGNALAGEKQVHNLLFPKLLSINNELFGYQDCNFSQKNMRTKGKKDGLSKKGTGRVALYNESGMVQCYTLEANYNMGMPSDADPCPVTYTPGLLRSVGESVLVTLLDEHRMNPSSVLHSTTYQDLNGVLLSISRSLKQVNSATSFERIKKTLSLPTIPRADDLAPRQRVFKQRPKRPADRGE
eukprot:TRINITY_DN3199_c0_g2_i1.p1 TRINITY_DN3199_c0_g2~~TRINITY_DN3199_c0_g2_i1.p1  ORF type:complete len:482 (+),score=108.99 TRINITY_DN3199_c0_g2_i1:48-1493(+)